MSTNSAVDAFDEWTATLPTNLTFDERLARVEGWIAAHPEYTATRA